MQAFNASMFLEETIMAAEEASKHTILWESRSYAMEGPFDEVEEAWKKIELLPAETFADLAEARNLLVGTVSLSDPKLNGTQIELYLAKQFFGRTQKLIALCPGLIKSIDAAIDRLRPLNWTPKT